MAVQGGSDPGADRALRQSVSSGTSPATAYRSTGWRERQPIRLASPRPTALPYLLEPAPTLTHPRPDAAGLPLDAGVPRRLGRPSS